MMFKNLALGRGLLRLWIVISIAWLCAVALVMRPRMPIAWPWSATSTIHVRVSDTETWDYPAALGIERIREAVTKRVAERNAQEQQFVAAMSAQRKASCNAPSPDSQSQDDCWRLFMWRTGARFGVSEEWEAQFQGLPIPMSHAGLIVAPLAVGPPLLLLIFGLAFGWVVKGFRCR